MQPITDLKCYNVYNSHIRNSRTPIDVSNLEGGKTLKSFDLFSIND